MTNDELRKVLGLSPAEAAWEPPWTPEEESGYGFAGGIWEGIKRGAQQTIEDIPGGIRDIPEGISRALTTPTEEEYQAMTPWERLKGVGGQVAGVGQAAMGPFRTLFAPLSGVTRAVSEIPYLWGETPGEERTPEREEGRLAGQIGFDLLSGIGLPRAISAVRGILASRGVAPPAAAAAVDMTRGRLLTGAVEEARPLALPEPSPGFLPPAGPPPPIPQPYPPTMGRTAVTVEDMLTGKTLRGTQKVPLTDSIEEVQRGLPPQEIPPGRTPHEAGSEIAQAAGQMRPGETIGQTMRRLRQEQNYLVSEDVAAGATGKPPDMSLRDWVKLNKRGEGEKLEAAVNAGPEARAAAPPHIQAAAEAVAPTEPSSIRSWINRVMPSGDNQFAWFFRKVQHPEFVTRNDPGAKTIIDWGIKSEREREFLESQWLGELVKIRNEFGAGNIKAGNAEIDRIFKMRDRNIAPTNQLDAQKLRRISPFSDEIGARIGITPDHPDYIHNYVTRARQNVAVEKSRLIQIGEYVAHDIKQMVPSRLMPYFTRKRRLDVPGDDYSMEYLSNWVRSAARAAVYGTPQKHGALQDLGPMLRGLDNSLPQMQEYVAKYVNYLIGAPGTRSPIESVRFGNLIRNLEFSRTIGFNPMSPIYNTLQRVPIFVETSAKAWLQGIRDEVAFYRGNKEMRELVKKAKIDPEAFSPSKLGMDELAATETALERGVGTIRDWSGKVFGVSEKGNRLHALFSGYRFGIESGLSEAEAIAHAVKVMEKTQFALGRAGRSEAFRKEPWATLGQYKSFPIRMMEYSYRNAEDVVKGLQTAVKTGDKAELLTASRRFVKLWGSTYALGGAAAIPFIGGALEKISPVQWKGIIPSMGMAIGEQMGLGVLDFGDFDSLKFWIPGPAFNHLSEIVQGTLGAAGVDLSAGGYGPPAKPGEAARLLTRSVPIGGVLLERLRRAGMMSPTGEEREPRNLAQAFGGFLGQAVPPTQPLIRKSESAFPRAQRALGIVPYEREQEATAFDTEERAREIKDRTVRAAQQARNEGRIAESNEILRKGEAQLQSLLGGRGRLKLTPQSRAAAQRAAKSPVLQRMREASGEQIGGFREDTIE